MSRNRLRQKGALAESQAIRPNEVRTDPVQDVDSIEDLRATKEMILSEAEYVLSVLREDRAFWDDVEKEVIACPRCGELLDPQTVYLSLASLDGYMLPDEAKRFLRGEGCPHCCPDFFELTPS